MPPVRVVPALDEVEDGHPGLGLGGEAAPVQQLALEGGEETLTEGVVVGVAHAPHGRPDTRLAAAEAKGDRGVLGGFQRSSQHRPGRGGDDYTEAAFGAGRTSQVALARPTLGWAA